jgi:hypothetical protein
MGDEEGPAGATVEVEPGSRLDWWRGRDRGVGRAVSGAVVQCECHVLSVTVAERGVVVRRSNRAVRRATQRPRPRYGDGRSAIGQ